MPKAILPYRNSAGSVEIDGLGGQPMFRPCSVTAIEAAAPGWRVMLNDLLSIACRAHLDGWTTINDEAPTVLAELGITHQPRIGVPSRKIEAIKVLRSRSGCSLREAKGAIEAAMVKLPEMAFTYGDTVFIRGIDVPWTYLSTDDGVVTITRGVGRDRVTVSAKEDYIWS